MTLLLLILAALLLGGLGASTVLLLRRRWLRAVGVLLLTPALMLAVMLLCRIDRVASWFWPNDTLYASGFSRDRFRALPLGADRQGVASALGEPLGNQVCGEKEYWYYSKHGRRYKNYWNMIVIFDSQSGRVVEKFSEFYTD